MSCILKKIIILSAILSSFYFNISFAEEKSTTLDTITVTANPLGRSSNDLVQPVTVLYGDNLLNRLQPTIGDTLSVEPGIRSSYNGPNASRPVIRGLSGDQINILQNGINNLDASDTSVDHNVAIDPLTIEKIEVIRGPAALLYGSRAVGGVVNVIDNRIPDQPISEKVTGMADARYNTANNEKSGSILLEGGAGKYAWHVNGFKRLTDNIEIPGFARSRRLRDSEALEADEYEEKDNLINSYSNNDGATIGISRFFKKGYFGIAFTNYESKYGVVGHEHHHEEGHEEEEDSNVSIDMKQRRIDLAGSYREPNDYIKEIKFKAGFSNYKHKEFENNESGTIFKNQGYDSRIELIHNKIGLFEGAIGLQSNRSDFSALGEEAFIPPTITKNNSIFIFEEIPVDDLTLQAGGRLDYQDVEAKENVNFSTARSRDDLTGSASIGFTHKLPKDYSFALSTAYTQRAPNSQELYANGEHIATSTFERGNSDLNIQKSVNLDLSLRKKSKSSNSELNLFYNSFQDFINLHNTGVEDTDSHLPIYEYINVPTEFFGVEFQTVFTSYDKNAHKLDLEFRGDYLEARDRRTKRPLPRIAPARIGTSAIYKYQDIGLRLDLNYVFAQNEVSENELKTDDYLMFDISTDYEVNIGATSSLLYSKITNLLNEEARNHVSFIKDRAPLPGRSIMFGIRTAF